MSAQREPQCSCGGCVSNAQEDARRLAAGLGLFSSYGAPRLGMLLRAIVLQRLLTWSYL